MLLPPLFAAVFGLLLWELLARTLQARSLPPAAAEQRSRAPPSPTARSLLGASLTTGSSALAGFVLSAVIGVVVAVLLSTSELVERAFHPYAILLQTVPIVAIAPLLVLWFGIGPRAVTASAFIVSVFPVITGTPWPASARSTRTCAISSVCTARRARGRLVAPRAPALGATPSIATGLRIAAGLAVIGAIVGEFVAGFAEGRPGLGIVVMSSYRQLRTDVLFGAVFCSTLLGLALFSFVGVFSHLYLRKWHVAEKDPR